MGTIIKGNSFVVLNKSGMLRPIIYCNPSEEMIAVAFSVNIALAEKLIAIKENRRAFRMDYCIKQVLDNLPDDPVIKDFDVLFNPKYEIDVIKVLIAAYKEKPFDIIWPGRFEDGKLIYAEDGYKDYKVYEISKYDITCVI